MSVEARPRLNVVLCWHMHQPQYSDLFTGQYAQPWTYLHAIKDYVDMAAHIEAMPGARAVVNFVPILLEQIDDYGRQVAAFLEEGRPIGDPLLNALACATLPSHTEQRLDLVRACLRVNEERVIRRFAPYVRLVEIARLCLAQPEMAGYLNDQFFSDLLVWYHLGWMAETRRRTDARIQRLQDKGSDFSLHDRRELVTVVGELLQGLIGRYRALAEAGQVELSVTPYAHPIIPLLLDFASAREAMPEAELPEAAGYPGGEERARWHIEEGLAVFERYFGRRPVGCWPAEGSLSEGTLDLLAEAGFRWTATGEQVLAHSVQQDPALKGRPREQWLFQGHAVGGRPIQCFFRDDGLSDLIGFTYSSWHADDAVANLVGHLENIARATADGHEHLVAIILDGENAWEYYPENGYYFLSALYRTLVEHPHLNLTTFSDCLQRDIPPGGLQRLVAGSWVYGTFSTWIADRDKNRAWDMLVDAKQTFDRVLAEGNLEPAQQRRAENQLAICEGSDWFWWFGDYNPAGAVHDFDRLYRLHLANLYRLLQVEPPEYLAHAFTTGRANGGVPDVGGVMRRGRPEGG